MFTILSFVRKFIGGKTEFGIIASIIVLGAYALGWFPWLDDPNEILNILKILGAITGTALLGRIEDKKGFVEGLAALFGPLRKKRSNG